jgi:hypothetical protein
LVLLLLLYVLLLLALVLLLAFVSGGRARLLAALLGANDIMEELEHRFSPAYEFGSLLAQLRGTTGSKRMLRQSSSMDPNAIQTT